MSERPDGVDPLALEQQVCFALSVAARSVVAVYRPLLEPMGLTHPQYLVMLALWQHAPLSGRDLSRLLQLDPGTLSPLLKRLEAAGYLRRERDPSDERSLAVTLTASGAALRSQAELIPAAIVQRLGLPVEDLQHLHAVLTQVIAAANRPGGDPTPLGGRRGGSGVGVDGEAAVGAAPVERGQHAQLGAGEVPLRRVAALVAQRVEPALQPAQLLLGQPAVAEQRAQHRRSPTRRSPPRRSGRCPATNRSMPPAIQAQPSGSITGSSSSAAASVAYSTPSRPSSRSTSSVYAVARTVPVFAISSASAAVGAEMSRQRRRSRRSRRTRPARPARRTGRSAASAPRRCPAPSVTS